MSAPTPNPEAKLYGLRYLSSYIEQVRQSGGSDTRLVDELHFLLTLANFDGPRKSQLGQDVFALAMTGFKRGGYFVEVGAHHGEQLSNTWLLEKAYGWNGLLVEPNPANHANLRQRTARLIDKAAWKRSGQELTFHATADSSLSKLAETRQSDAHDRTQFRPLTVQTITLDDMLAANGAPRVIDFISIDVEGSEADVLDGLSLKQWQVQSMCLEHNHDASRLAEFDRRLGAEGYERIFETTSDFDAYYALPGCIERWRMTWK